MFRSVWLYFITGFFPHRHWMQRKRCANHLFDGPRGCILGSFQPISGMEAKMGVKVDRTLDFVAPSFPAATQFPGQRLHLLSELFKFNLRRIR
jgi:hypothetical protein